MSSPKLLKGRTSSCGACYLVTTVLHRRARLFSSPIPARLVIEEMRRIEAQGGVISIAWVLMPDHLHWLLQLEEGSLSRCVQAFKSCTARAINAAEGREGPVWQAGFHDRRLRREDDLLLQARYVIANPLRGGLVERIEDYPYWACRWNVHGSDLVL